MELFLAQNHAPMTHLPIACSILAAAAAIAGLFFTRKEVSLAWALLSIIAFVTVLPTIFTGIQAARGRMYITEGIQVNDDPENADIKLHQQLGTAGAVVSLVFMSFGIRRLRGKSPNRYVIVVLAVAMAILWGIGGHMGGKALWGPDTFPAYEDMLPEE